MGRRPTIKRRIKRGSEGRVITEKMLRAKNWRSADTRHAVSDALDAIGLDPRDPREKKIRALIHQKFQGIDNLSAELLKSDVKVSFDLAQHALDMQDSLRSEIRKLVSMAITGKKTTEETFWNVLKAHQTALGKLRRDIARQNR